MRSLYCAARELGGVVRNIDSFELVRSHFSDVPRCFRAELTGNQIQVARIFEIDIKRVVAETQHLGPG